MAACMKLDLAQLQSQAQPVPFKKAGQASAVARIHRCIHAWIPEGLKNWVWRVVMLGA